MKIINGDSLKELKTLEENSIDAVVTDPPYGLKFMGKKWDYDVPSTELWVEVMRVLKPGGHLLSFAGSRTYHRMAVNIEDAGFEIRDQIMWVYGSGFPKSHNIGKSVDKLQGNEREVIGKGQMGRNLTRNGHKGDMAIDELHQAPIEPIITKGSSPYEGWGTALKPAHEPIVVARKPLSEKTIAKNVLEWGTGGINIDGCRVGSEGGTKKVDTENCRESLGKYGDGLNGGTVSRIDGGRFPANFIHDGSDEVVGLFPDSNGQGKHKKADYNANQPITMGGGQVNTSYTDKGSAARFFYCAKASKKDRNEGCEDVVTNEGGEERKGNVHSTVKPTALMQYLVRLVTPVGGTVLDPFMGSGSTGKACVLEGFDFIGIELDPEYCKIAEARIDAVK